VCNGPTQPTPSSLVKATSNLLVIKISDAVVNLKNWISLVLSKPLM